MAPEIRRNPPPYQQIAAALREQITTGAVADGALLPSARQLGSDWNVSAITASKALAALAAEGLVTIRPNVGAIVTTDGLNRSGRDRATAARKTGRIYTPGEYAVIRAAELTAAPDDVAAVLGLEPGAQVIRRHRTTHGPDDAVTSASTSWYDGRFAETAPALLVAERIPAGSWAYLEERTGLSARRGIDQIKARLATDAEVAELGLTAPAAVKVSTTTLWTDDGQVIEYGVSVARSGRRSSYEYLLGE